MNFEYKYYRDNGVCISYFVTGKGNPILLLQGGATNILAYKDFLELLARNYMVIAADVPCFGNASVPKKFYSIVKGFIK